jgi:acyl-CoA synthetase (AMP-forming)/AMP-acid ligase II
VSVSPTPWVSEVVALPDATVSRVDTVADILRTGARRFPDRVAVKLRETGETRSYRDLDERTTSLANALLDVGLRRGERVCTWLPDSLEYIELYLAVAKAGLVLVPVNARLVAAEAKYIIEHSEPGLLVWSSQHAAEVPKVVESSAAFKTLTIGDSSTPSDFEYDALLSNGSMNPLPGPAPDDLYIIGYTSGTTGRPKGAMLTHRSTLAAGLLNAFSLRFTGHTVHALTGSMSFVSVVPGHVLSVLRMGGTLIMMGHWTVPDLVDVIERERATFTYVPSPMLAEFASLVAERPSAVATLNDMVHSASRGNPDHIKAMRDAIGPSRFIESWGMTEHSGAGVTATVPEDHVIDAERALASVGRPTVHAAVRLIDASGAALPADGVTLGELVVSSPALMTGYWRNDEATATAFLDGWYRTGDLGTIDPEGYVTIHERRTDLIISGGMNVYPSEVEYCIQQLNGVVDVCVVDEAHPRWGQAVVAVVVRTPGSDLDEAQIIAHCRANMASYKKPSKVVFVDELPKTAGLKVARAKVRASVRGETSE